jgi:hypothetical protein
MVDCGVERRLLSAGSGGCDDLAASTLFGWRTTTGAVIALPLLGTDELTGDGSGDLVGTLTLLFELGVDPFTSVVLLTWLVLGFTFVLLLFTFRETDCPLDVPGPRLERSFLRLSLYHMEEMVTLLKIIGLERHRNLHSQNEFFIGLTGSICIFK